MNIGAHYHGNGKGEFVVWAPFLKSVALKIISPEQREIPMEKNERGYWRVLTDGVSPGARYLYRLEDGCDRPDPASFSQPDGVHEASEFIDHHEFSWGDHEWRGIPLEAMIIYEIHVGTFTPAGTLDAVTERLDDLVELGVNTVEIMPVAQFPGERNWGYDGTYPFAVQKSYGGPAGLKNMVNACHKQGLSVILDVVYNHVGPEGNYLAEFGPYFTDKYKTPWGKAINFDDACSDEVRNYFIQNARSWFEYYHLDALRLDAIHGIYDMSAHHILEELAEDVEAFSRGSGRKRYLIAESDLNNVKVIQQRGCGGYGIDAQWCDDFHHALHTLLTAEKSGYYADFGSVEHLVKGLNEGLIYSGQYSVFRKRRHGSSSRGLAAQQFVVFSQNHDQVGNRMQGERLSLLVSFEALKLAAGVTLLSPYIPLLFMGEEYAEETPFLYFISHSDDDLIRAVREGRRKEFEVFQWKRKPPDPQSMEAFFSSKLQWHRRREGKHMVMYDLYRKLISFRKEIPALTVLDKNRMTVSGDGDKKLVAVHRWHEQNRIFLEMNFSTEKISVSFDHFTGEVVKLLDSSDTRWMGPGSSAPEALKENDTVTIQPLSFVLYTGE